MNLACPHCQHGFTVREVRSGQYCHRCLHCHQAFALIVRATEGEPVVDVIPVARKATIAVSQANHPPFAGLAPQQDVVDPTMAEGAEGEPNHDFAFTPGSVEPAPSVCPALRLGGYEIIRPLGRGGMGTVYLARQISLDRHVALKVMHRRCAADPAFVARFAREAHAAARLVHHNIVQIYDVGTQDGVPFFSMEYVKGHTLTQLLRGRGRLDPVEAVGYILQAARGLQFAHAEGLVHRDVKPDNLIVNEHGIVKVADLGLVKGLGLCEAEVIPQALDSNAQPEDEMTDERSTPMASLSGVTRVGTAMGTPAYMAPEQARNAARAEPASDIYSLGCTLYALLTGRPPFQGKTALEILQQHVRGVLVPPEHLADGIPRDLSAVVLKMLARHPGERHSDMAAVVNDLEAFLQRRSESLTPKAGEIEALTNCSQRFREVPSAALRSRLLLAFFIGFPGLALVTGGFSPRWALAVLVLMGMSLFASFLIRGVTSRTYLFLRIRELLLEATLIDWLTGLAGLSTLLVLLYSTDLLHYWLGFAVLALALAGVYHVFVQRPLEVERRQPLEQTERLLRRLRLRGVPEEAVWELIAESSHDWEEFFEALLGYPALVKARALRNRPDVKPWRTYAPWRDLIIRWIEGRQAYRAELRDRRLVDAYLRNQPAETTTTAPEASEVRSSESVSPSVVPEPVQPSASFPHQPERRRTVWSVARLLLGPRARFLLGVLFLVGFCAWLVQNDLMPGDEPDPTVLFARLRVAQPLSIWPSFLSLVFDSVNAGVVALLLILSAFTRKRRLLVFLMPAIVILIVLPHLGLPALRQLSPHTLSLIVGLALVEFGMVFTSFSTRGGRDGLNP